MLKCTANAINAGYGNFCPTVKGHPAVPDGAYFYPQSSWNMVNPHGRRLATLYGQTDGAVLRVRYLIGDASFQRPAYERIWEEKWGPQF